MGTLQLQRQLYEAHGIDKWKDCDDTIPVLEEQGVLLSVLDISDEIHPSTKRRSQLIKGHEQASIERSSETEMSNGPLINTKRWLISTNITLRWYDMMRRRALRLS